MAHTNGRVSDSDIRAAYDKLANAPNDAARLKVLEGFTFGMVVSLQNHVRQLYSRLPKRPWVWGVVQSIGVGGIVAIAVWFGSFQASVKAETTQAVATANRAEIYCQNLDSRARALESALVELLARQSERDRRAGVEPPTQEDRRAIARKFGFDPPADTIRP
jgi:hypothetical protein